MSVDSFPEVIRKALDVRQESINTCKPGKILSYNKSTRTAEVQLVITDAVENVDGDIVYEDPPILSNVLVCFPFSGLCSIVWDLLPGDHVAVLFCDSDIAQWRTSGSVSNPDIVRRHGLHSGLALPMCAPDVITIPGQTTPATLTIEAPSIVLGFGAVDFVALDLLVRARFTELLTALNAAVPMANDGGANLRTTWLAALVVAGWAGAGTIPPSVGATSVKAK